MKTAQEIFEALLKARGIDDIDRFIKPDYEDLSDPYLMPDMKWAVSRLQAAHNRGEKVAVYGDYDVDGMTATTLLLDAFSRMGFQVTSFIPDRFVDGYGLSERGIDLLAKDGVKLFVTVDTGSMSHQHIAYAKEKHGIDVIVTDHHSLNADLPDAVAVINPKRSDSNYPYRDLAGVGVAFTLVRAMQQTSIGLPAGHEKWLLDLVALGTVCDIVPLTGENRILVYYGLRVLAKTRRPGLRELVRVSDSDLENITTTALGYRLGPRLNASGRLAHASTSMELLRTTDQSAAGELARRLNDLNSERRQQQAEIMQQALQMSGNKTGENVHIFVHPDWSHGIVGIVASKLMEATGKPVFVLQQIGDVAKGSARSFGDFHLAEAIAAHQHLLVTGGGHAKAAGITISMDRLEEFRQAINNYYDDLNLQQQADYLKHKSDLQLASLSGLNMDLIKLIEQLEPFGQHNEQPLFEISNVVVSEWRGVGREAQHAKVRLTDSGGASLEGIGFSLADSMPEAGSVVTATTALEANSFRGTTKPQLVLKEIRVDT